MALKPDRSYEEVVDIAQHWSELDAQTTAEEGGVAVLETQGSGVGLDDTVNVVQYAAGPSGTIPMGVLLHPVAPAMSATRDFKNFDRLESRPGEKVALLRKGWLVTDMVIGSPTAGGVAYLGVSGMLNPVQGAGAPAVGRFENTKDADGFVRVFIDI